MLKQLFFIAIFVASTVYAAPPKGSAWERVNYFSAELQKHEQKKSIGDPTYKESDHQRLAVNGLIFLASSLDKTNKNKKYDITSTRKWGDTEENSYDILFDRIASAPKPIEWSQVAVSLKSPTSLELNHAAAVRNRYEAKWQANHPPTVESKELGPNQRIFQFIPTDWQKSTAAQKYPPKILLQVVRKAINEDKIPGEKILAGFDFDGTVSILNPAFLPFRGKPNIKDTPPKSILRGGDAMKAALKELDEAGVNLVIDTAAGAPGIAAGVGFTPRVEDGKAPYFAGTVSSITQQILDYGIYDFFPFDWTEKTLEASKDKATLVVLNQIGQAKIPSGSGETTEDVISSGNIVTALKKGYAKPQYLQVYWTNVLKMDVPHLVIFFDDGAINVVKMALFFKENFPDTQFIGVHVPQYEDPLFRGYIAALVKRDRGAAEAAEKESKTELLEPGEIEHAFLFTERLTE